MNSKMKYPAIIDNGKTQKVLIFSDGRGIHLGGEFAGDHIDRYIIDSDCKNITHEYLTNTYGEVVSPEHAEFIIELAKNAGFGVSGLTARSMCFEFSGDCNVVFYEIPVDIFANNEESKKITIPLPPKPEASVDEMSIAAGELTTEEETELKSRAMASELDRQGDKWPQVGDKVTVFGQQGVVVLPADKHGVFIVEANRGYLAPQFRDLSKPKSKQDLLIEELQTKLVNNNAVDSYILACDIINGDIDGLSYVGGKKSDTGGE